MAKNKEIVMDTMLSFDIFKHNRLNSQNNAFAQL